MSRREPQDAFQLRGALDKTSSSFLSFPDRFACSESAESENQKQPETGRALAPPPRRRVKDPTQLTPGAEARRVKADVGVGHRPCLCPAPAFWRLSERRGRPGRPSIEASLLQVEFEPVFWISSQSTRICMLTYVYVHTYVAIYRYIVAIQNILHHT